MQRGYVMSKNIPLVTVVVPVYNVAAHLDEAVESVLKQTIAAWEMILVDDGSTDASGHLCDKWAARDARIRAIHKDNSGPASARNAGLEQARGEWVMFLDSDDLWQERMLETMLNAAPGADVVCCGLHFFPEDGPDLWVDQPCFFPSLDEMAEEAEYLFSRNCINSACTKLYRRKSIRIRFDETLRHAEDLFFNLHYFRSARGIRFIPDKLYLYRKDGSLTLGSAFWFDQPQICRRQWEFSREAFADHPGALTFFDKRYVYEISRHLLILSELDTTPEAQRLFLLQLYLEEPLLKEPCFADAPKTEAAARLWMLISQGDARGVFDLCRAEGRNLLGFIWARR